MALFRRLIYLLGFGAGDGAEEGASNELFEGAVSDGDPLFVVESCST
jgi:hypothetical protein